MQNNNTILPKFHDEAVKQKPPPASISHSSRAAPTPPTQRQHHTRDGGGGGRVQRVSAKKREFHHLPASLFAPLKKKKKQSSRLLSSSSFCFIFLLFASHPLQREEKMHQKIFLFSDAIQHSLTEESRGEEYEERSTRSSSFQHFHRQEWDAVFFWEWERETTKCAVGLLLIFLPSLPPFPACLQHMSPPLVAMATAPHVADRRRKRRGRGGEDKREEGRPKEREGKMRKEGKHGRKDVKRRRDRMRSSRRRREKGATMTEERREKTSSLQLVQNIAEPENFVRSQTFQNLFGQCSNIHWISGNKWKYLRAISQPLPRNCCSVQPNSCNHRLLLSDYDLLR